MDNFNPSELKNLYIPPPTSHKGQNGKVMIIGGSHLFHAASLWALEIASKIVDMVFYASVPENEKIVQDAKEAFRNGIVVRRDNIEDYIQEADSVLIGPGMLRTKLPITNYPVATGSSVSRDQFQISNISEIDKIDDEGEQTYYFTKYLLGKYPQKKWIIDAGALQMLDLSWVSGMQNVILTPHLQEFERVFGLPPLPEHVKEMAQKYNCNILLKAAQDVICSPTECVLISGGNAGMTKGGTGDVLAGLVAALAATNDMFLAAKAGSYINKKAGDVLFNTVGYYFNASDLIAEIPKVMKTTLINKGGI